MKKLYVVADVHSFYEEMIKALSEQGFDRDNPSHIFVSLGDLFDRGPAPLECLDFVNSLSAERKILIRGNHEVRENPQLLEYLSSLIILIYKQCENAQEAAANAAEASAPQRKGQARTECT